MFDFKLISFFRWVSLTGGFGVLRVVDLSLRLTMLVFCG